VTSTQTQAPPAAAGAAAFKAMLDNCEREPIHMPGSIQPAGALVAFEPGAGTLLHASTNLGRWLPVGALPVKGRSLSELLGSEADACIRRALAARAGGPVRHEVLDLPARPAEGQPVPLEAVVHGHAGVGFAEFEPASAPAGDGLQGLSDTIDALRSASGLDELCQRMAQRVKRLTRFDRVMVYRFDERHNGHVVAESRESAMESFLDLHYPASDIPAQARELYASNLVRYIPDVDYTPVPVLPWLDSERLQPLDMSHAVLRSVSPMHLRYLRNMGVGSTLTLSLLVDGRLWGLIACHHRTRTALPIRLRRACYALAVTAGYMTGWFTGQQRLAAQAEAARARSTIVEAFNQVQVPLADVIEHCTVPLLQLTGATGGAFWRGDEWMPFGRWPDAARGGSVLRHVRHAFETSAADRIDTEHAELQPALADDELRLACGLLAIKFDSFASSGLVWLRPEQRQEVAWGGDPDTPVQVETDGNGQPVPSPRSSFARWTTLVKGRCRPWSDLDREAASSLDVLRQVLVVRDALAQVSLSERHFRSLVTLQSDAYWQTDAHGQVVTMSRPLPFEHGPLQGRTLPEVFEAACGGDDDAGVRALREALAARQPFRGIRLSGGTAAGGAGFVLQISGARLLDAEGATTGWHGTLSDRTHEVAMQTAVREKAAAELASLEKSKFLSQVSHELRTPLNAVLGFSQLVIADATTPAPQRQLVEHVVQAGDWLLKMISDLLELSKTETGHLDVSLTAVDVRRLFDELQVLLGTQAAERTVDLQLPPPGAAVWVRADPARLLQVLLNLGSNAIKYNRAGGQVQFTVADEPGTDEVRLAVADTGDGLTPAQIEHLFEPFNRLGREGSAVGGTGIGLVITRQLVALMGGRIEVQSTPGRGSRFSVLLAKSAPPAPDGAEVAPPAFPEAPSMTAPPASLAPPARDSRGFLVCHVEDEPINERLIRTFVVERLGLGYVSASSAEQGLQLARERRPAVMLIDLNLPGRDGLWLGSVVRGDPALKGTHLVAVTADATPQTRARLLAAGFEACWSKPVDLTQMGQFLQALAAGAG
jgi:light-regulated signal transduction histidine kinase (bacteriophytochrome)/CheY-like chemotaxis protein